MNAETQRDLLAAEIDAMYADLAHMDPLTVPFRVQLLWERKRHILNAKGGATPTAPAPMTNTGR